ncbi:MAG: glutaredoxin family protein [Acidobacteria bacterium]|jgi:glutaredoxin|nr:glutaredoxin family protein [Acidobacteriota bacterium]
MVTVYSRHGCHLCEDAEKTLQDLQKELNFEMEVIYIDANETLEKLYGHEVPVIHINGEHHDFFRVNPERFRASLEKHRRHQ